MLNAAATERIVDAAFDRFAGQIRLSDVINAGAHV
jgi:hypothetical protein